MALINVKIIRDLHLPEEEGIHFRILCMTGKNKGIAYYLIGNRVIMGRGDKVDIQILDVKSSREHAELKLRNGQYIVTDLGSQNGLIINDLKISQHVLSDGDKIIIGTTVLKFNKYDIKKKKELLLIEEDNGEDEDEDNYEGDFEEEEEFEEEERARLDEKKKKKNALEKKGSNKKIIIVVIAGALAFLFMEEEKPKKSSSPKSTKSKMRALSLDERLRSQENESSEVEKKMNAIIHRGQREFRERNFFRAIRQFELALILSPNNGRASFYLERSKQRLDEEIEASFLKARREADGLKYRSSAVSYCSVVRLLQKFPDDERYRDAITNLRIVEKEMGLAKNEIMCVQK